MEDFMCFYYTVFIFYLQFYKYFTVLQKKIAPYVLLLALGNLATPLSSQKYVTHFKSKWDFHVKYWKTSQKSNKATDHNVLTWYSYSITPGINVKLSEIQQKYECMNKRFVLKSVRE